MWTPDPASIITAEEKAEQARAALIERFRIAIQSHVDETAQSRRYDSGVSLASYVASSNSAWSAEATAFVTWRDAVWVYTYGELDRVLAGEREQPAVGGFIAELPEIEWPG